MINLAACATCGADRPTNRTGTGPWCCSLACYRRFHNIEQPPTQATTTPQRPARRPETTEP